MAEKYSVFVLMLDEHASDITAAAQDLPLTFDANTIANGSVPELGYLPFELKIQLPSGQTAGDCPSFQLRDLAIDITVNHGKPRDPTYSYAGFTFGISGCSRESTTISNFQFHAVGYGSLEFSFLTIRDSHDILSIEPSHDVGGPADDALKFIECNILSSTFHYFGDVTGDLGQTFGLTQNGSRVVDTNFKVANPATSVPHYAYRDDGDGYRFSWLGSFPEEWNTTTANGFMHMSGSTIEYIRDVSLGSVNVSNCSFVGWLSLANPIFSGTGARSTANPPAINLYNMESVTQPKRLRRDRRWLGGADKTSLTAGLGEGLTYGCNVSDSSFQYIWDVDLLQSAVSRSTFRWSAQGMPVPSAWTGKPTNPSFWVNLLTSDIRAGFIRSINSSLACMRPEIQANGSRVPAQQVTLEKDSQSYNTKFLHTTDAACSSAMIWLV